jgi:hypothetical protein
LNNGNYILSSQKFYDNPIDIIAATSPAPADSPVAANSTAQPQPQPSPPPAAAAAPAAVSASSPTSVAVRTPTATATPASVGATDTGTTNNKGRGSPTALTFHKTEWLEAIQSVLEQDINRSVVRRLWSIKDCSSGTLLEQDCDQGNLMSRLNYFLCMFPPQALFSIVRLTSQQLLLLLKAATTKGEVVKCFGVIILATKFEFDDRRSLWRPQQR